MGCMDKSIESSVRLVKLNGARMRSCKGAHAYIAKKLGFPSYYGNNLDALFDVLSTWGNPVVIKIKNTKQLRRNLGEYGQAMLHTFEEAAQSNRSLKLIMAD